MSSFSYIAKLKQAFAAADVNDWNRAHNICNDLHPHGEKDPTLLALMARVASNRNQIDDAQRYLKLCISLEPENLLHQLNLASLFTQTGQYKKAVLRFKKMLRQRSDHAGVVARFADAYFKAGEPHNAKKILVSWIDNRKEDKDMAMVWGRIALNENNPKDAIRVLTRHVAGNLPGGELSFILGKAYEQVGEYENAFDAFAAAHNQPKAPFHLDHVVQTIRDNVSAFRSNTFKQMPLPERTEEGLVFIVGRPLSGTALAEAILDSHPMASSTGEIHYFPVLTANLSVRIDSMLPYPACASDMDQNDINQLSQEYLNFIQSATRKSTYFIDRNVENHLHLGLIQMLFPKSRVIHIRRSVADNCWACYTANLTYPWASDPRLLGITHRLYERLMKHWHHALDIPILDVDYESLVNDREGATHRMLQFCDLPWDEQCIRFDTSPDRHKTSASKTRLNYDQRLEYSDMNSVGRSKNYESFLRELNAGLEEGNSLAASIDIEASPLKYHP